MTKQSNKLNKITSENIKKNDYFLPSIQRRQMLKLMGASFAFAGIGIACRRAESKILPYSKHPEEIIPGISNYFATTIPLKCGAVGIIVKSNEGRPTKIEGNIDHPASNGVTNVQIQASILQLYDPDRSRTPTLKKRLGRENISWQDWSDFISYRFDGSKGENIGILLGEDNSLTFKKILYDIKKKYPKIRYYNDEYKKNKNELNFFGGEDFTLYYNFDNAKTILSCYADPLMQGLNSLEYAYKFSNGRRVYSSSQAYKMNRLYTVEAAVTVTGTNSDHRLRLPENQGLQFIEALTYELLTSESLNINNNLIKKEVRDTLLSIVQRSYGLNEKYIKSIAIDLLKNQGTSIILVGERQSILAKKIGFILNILLFNLNKTFYVKKEKNIDINYKTELDINNLMEDAVSKKIDTLLIVDSNPIYKYTQDYNVKKILIDLKHTVHIGLYENETAYESGWHIPRSHFLESWGDAMSGNGVQSIIQPLIAPLHNTKSKIEILGEIAYNKIVSGDILVKETWTKDYKIVNTDKEWRKVLYYGKLPGTFFEIKENISYDFSFLKDLSDYTINSNNNLELLLLNDYSISEESFANIGWLQEMPDPISKITWGNALYISPSLSRRLKVKSRVKGMIYRSQIVTLSVEGRKLNVPTFIMPGLADNTVTLTLGYGRKQVGAIGNGIGVNGYTLLLNNIKNVNLNLKIETTKKFVHLATSQEQFAMNGDALQEVDTLTLNNRHPVIQTSVSNYTQNANFVDKYLIKYEPIQMTDPWEYNGNKWGMVIDLNVCIGCNTCLLACQAENNIPVVGPKQVMRGRIMHWIRVDRYMLGSISDPITVTQPIPCMQCENAPCEAVCPVAATTHDTEGLNSMAYNRCIGTRYCANNCPYKVRRFNYFDYTNSGNLYVDETNRKRRRLLQMQYNPNVTVRYRGVMEKCTYCTQRITEARIKARRHGKNPNELKENAVIPACAQSCPTKAIIFGNLNDIKSQVVALKNVDRNYDLLGELNVRPRTSYLAKLRNLNPELV